MSHLVIQDLTKIHSNGKHALSNLNLTIQQGEFVVVVGPSGCGKSTLLRLIAGLDRPTSGNIEIGGVCVNDSRPVERNVGMVFQDYALYPHMNVRDNLSFGLKMQKMKSGEVKKRVEEACSILELGGLLARKPAELSGGQRQRVAIGRAMVKHPAVFLLDEPLSNLDAQLRAQTRIELAALHRRIQSTTLYVTHDQEEAMTLAERVIILDKGILQQFAPPLEIYHKPANRFVASFIGNPRMNFLEGHLELSQNRLGFITEGQELLIDSPRIPKGLGPHTLGFRPESVQLGEGLRASLTWVEYLGHEIHVIGKIGDQQIVLRTSDPESVSLFKKMKPGSEFTIKINQKNLHWFGTALKSEPELAVSILEKPFSTDSIQKES